MSRPIAALVAAAAIGLPAAAPGGPADAEARVRERLLALTEYVYRLQVK